MDRAEASRIAHGELRLWNPLSEAALDEAIALLELAPGASVLDVGAGRGEVLRRVAARWDLNAFGYDSDAALVEGTGLEVRDSPPPGPFDLVICIASSHALGGFPEAPAALQELTAPGGQVLLGEGYWRRPPSEEYLRALGDACGPPGLPPLHSSVASEADWDRYEWRLILNAERWAAANADDPGAELVRDRARRARERMTMPQGRETLGFALTLLRRQQPRAEPQEA